MQRHPFRVDHFYDVMVSGLQQSLKDFLAAPALGHGPTAAAWQGVLRAASNAAAVGALHRGLVLYEQQQSAAFAA
jgi:hypothetical protein